MIERYNELLVEENGIIAEMDKLNARMEELIERWSIINAQKEEIVKELEMEKHDQIFDGTGNGGVL